MVINAMIVKVMALAKPIVSCFVVKLSLDPAIISTDVNGVSVNKDCLQGQRQ